MSVPRKRTYTIAEAAELTGLSRKAVTRRVERGSLRSLVRRGRRLIPRSELVRTGLVPPEAEPRDRAGPTPGLPSPPSTPSADPLSPFGDHELAPLLRELLERLERQAGEIAHYRAITAQAESLRWSNEVSELRVRLSALENERRPPELEAGVPPSREEPPSLGVRARTGLPDERIWLPASAGGAEARIARVSGEPAGSAAAPAAGALPRSLGRRLAFAVEAILIAGVAAGAWLANLPPTGIVAAVGIAWIVVALLEWLRYGDR
jgi:excisionase family DNA binding protein